MKRGKRGVAMLMVVIALVVTTVLTTAILTSPDRMGPIAQNAQDGAQARWSAESAGNFTVAAIEQDVAATDIGGLFKDKWNIAKGAASVIVTNSEGALPTVDDRSVFITVDSRSGEISETVQRLIHVTPAMEAEEVADTRLGELALYAIDSLRLHEVTVRNYKHSSVIAESPPRIGVGMSTSAGTDLNSLNFMGDFVVGSDAGNGLIAHLDASTPGKVIELPIRLPSGVTDMPTLSGIDISNRETNISLTDGVELDLPSGEYKIVNMSKSSTLRLGGGMYCFDNVVLTGESRIILDADTRLVVKKKLEIKQGSYILVRDGYALNAWIGELLKLDTGFITPAEPPPFVADWFAEIRAKVKPSQVLLEFDANADVMVYQDSGIIGSIHAPGSSVTIHDSHFIGRLTAREIDMYRSVQAYDPAFDSGFGYTNLDGPLYDSGGGLLSGLVTVLDAAVTLDPDAAKTAIANTLETQWALDGAPRASGSGYWGAKSKKRAKMAGDSPERRQRKATLAAWKEFWLDDDVESRNAETIANLEDDDD